MAQAPNRGCLQIGSSHLNTSLKWLGLASLTHLVGNVLGTMIALQQNVQVNFGSFLNGQVSLRDFSTATGTALLIPFAFWSIQLGLTILAMRSGRLARIGIAGLILVGGFSAITGLGTGAVLFLSPDGIDRQQAIAFLINVPLAIAMTVLGISAWGTLY